ncbi:MAG: type II 3-dehydroquinate dehydratase [Candidatus Eisenbacteria bacterium RBG_16_71_46]|nr:MAG: type II 3-dehydroquinate dehydratase [Candidatus Eisenbacteria bacterium RBG_16_71_46]OGF22812.1 MAG: type II 3-dehydroquinate dehydratase [Candidatus Eisenbacteria bacterium RBG_19FT_COMBO_70_11]
MHRILVLNGPNLNALGSREPDVYGRATLEDLQQRLVQLAAELGCEIESLQSNHEGVLIDALYRARESAHGVLLNPAGLTHTSVALRDAVAAAGIPLIEVHVSNPHARESFRRVSTLSSAALGVVQGFGVDSYLLALRGLVGYLDRAGRA